MTDFRIDNPNAQAPVSRVDHTGKGPALSDPDVQDAAIRATQRELLAQKRARVDQTARDLRDAYPGARP